MTTLQMEEDVQAQNLLTKHADRVRYTKQGDRNRALRDSSRFIGHLVGAQRIDRTHAEQTLLDAALASGQERDHSFDTIKRGIVYGESEPMYRLTKNTVTEYIYEDENSGSLFRVVKGPEKQFRQQRYENGEWVNKLTTETRRVLYRLPRILEAVEQGLMIWLVEGEKDVETLEAHGLYATTTPHGSGSWNASYAETLAGAKVNIIADYDEPGIKYALKAHDDLLAQGCTVSMFLPTEEGQDVTDHIESGMTFKELIPCTRDELEMRKSAMKSRKDGGIISHAELMLMDVPPQQWVVEDLIAPGVTLLFSVPKGRKSFFCLDLGISVSTGRPMLDKFPVKQGSVLYLALEDSAMRLRARSDKILAGALPGPLYLFPIDSGPWGNLDEDGADRIVDWARSVKDPRLIIIDVFEKVRGRRKGDSVYGTDYEAIRPLGEIAKETGCAVVVVHHTSKRDYNPDDPMISASGSNGLRGSVDNLIFLRKKGDEGSLVIEGRDLNPAEVPLMWDQPNLRWVLGDKPLDEDDLLELTKLIKVHGPITRRVAMSTIGGDKVEADGTIRRLLSRGLLAEDRRSGEISLPDPNPGTEDSSLW